MKIIRARQMTNITDGAVLRAKDWPNRYYIVVSVEDDLARLELLGQGFRGKPEIVQIAPFRIRENYDIQRRRFLSRHETTTIHNYLKKKWEEPSAEDLPQPQDYQPGDICRPEDEE